MGLGHRSVSGAGVGALALGVACAHGLAAVTFTQATRTIQATTTTNNATDTVTSQTLDPLVATVQQNAPVDIGGQTVNTGAMASISCTFDPEGVKARTRLQGNGATAQAAGVASTLIDVIVTIDTPTPYRIRSDAIIFSSEQSSLGVALSSVAGGQTVFQTAAGHTGLAAVDVAGVLAAGEYHFVYDAQLVASGGNGDRDFDLKFEIGCPADVDDGTSSGNADGAVNIDDLIFYLGQFEAGADHADLDNGDGLGVKDGAVNIDDLIYFLTRFEQGC